MPKPASTLPAYHELDLPEPPADRPYVLVNMVMSADGKITIEGTEQGLGSAADQRVMRLLRVNADAVMNGANTLRKSGSSPDPGSEDLIELRRARGRAPRPLGVIVSERGELPLDSAFFTSTDFEAVVFLTSDAPRNRRKALQATRRKVIDVPPRDTMASVLRILRQDYDVRVLLLEGGATINGAMFDGGYIDEYFVTVGARLVGGSEPLTPISTPHAASFATTRRLRLVSAIPNPATDEVYLRYRVGDLMAPPGE